MNCIIKNLFVPIMFLSVALCASARELTAKDIHVKYDDCIYAGRFRVIQIKNNYVKPVKLFLINEYDGISSPVSIDPGKSISYDWTCNIVRAIADGEDYYVTLKKETKIPGVSSKTKKTELASAQVKKPGAVGPPLPPGQGKKKAEAEKKDTVPPIKLVKKDTLLAHFHAYVDNIRFLSLAAIAEDSAKIYFVVDSILAVATDKNVTIEELHLRSFADSLNDTISSLSAGQEGAIAAFLKRYSAFEIEDSALCVDSMKTVYSRRLDERRLQTSYLSNALLLPPTPISINWLTVCVCAALLVLLVGLFLWYRKANRKFKDVKKSVGPGGPSMTDASSAIVVMGTSKPLPMKRQDISDVVNNGAYMKIDCHEFCADSAVRTIYLKNSCIKDIYKMYADDLRDPQKMNEDGCLVIGRWVKDEKSGRYDVTLEETVMPGDDAVFAEYELNFGGKIKLKLSDRLRRLRRDTDLQYELTCWVHSHPGLGVFFSSADDNVHHQLSRPTCPQALTAMVIDILTDDQELGIFTYKQTGGINAKPDLTRMYSLEEMYKWAVESERHAIRPDDYYNTLDKAAKHRNECYGVELSNGAVIDMSMTATEKSTGFVGRVYGFVVESNSRCLCVANTVTSNENNSEDELVGCFVMAAHCSIPSVRRTVTDYLEKVRFVMVYTASDGLLTTIPVIDHELCSDEEYYGEQKLEDLKIWTKRRR